MSDYYWEADDVTKHAKLQPLLGSVPFYFNKLESFVQENNGYLVLGKVRALRYIKSAFNS